MTNHRFFSAETNFVPVPSPSKRIGIMLNPAPPQRLDDGTTRLSVRFAALVVSEYVNEPDKFAEMVADVLNENAHRFSGKASAPESDGVAGLVRAARAVLHGDASPDDFTRLETALEALQPRGVLKSEADAEAPGKAPAPEAPNTCADSIRENGFEVGDLVQLMSGGHPMTITTGDCCYKTCAWSDGITYYEEEIPARCLKPFPSDDIPF